MTIDSPKRLRRVYNKYINIVYTDMNSIILCMNNITEIACILLSFTEL